MAEQTMTRESTDKKKNDLVTKYLSDMVGLEEHIYQAVDKQVKGTEDEPTINPFLRNLRDSLQEHVDALKKRLDELGGHPGNPIKEAGAAALGVAAGLSNISYVMLVTTSLACDDSKTADLASRHLKDNAQFTMDIGKMIPDMVVKDLKDFTDLNEGAAKGAQEAYSDAWDQGASQKSTSSSFISNNGGTF